MAENKENVHAEGGRGEALVAGQKPMGNVRPVPAINLQAKQSAIPTPPPPPPVTSPRNARALVTPVPAAKAPTAPVQSVQSVQSVPAQSVQPVQSPQAPMVGQPLQVGVQSAPQSPRFMQRAQQFVSQGREQLQSFAHPQYVQPAVQPNAQPQYIQPTVQPYAQPAVQPQKSSMSGIRAGAIGFSLLSGLFPLPFNPLFLPIQMTIFIIMIIILLFKGWDFWTAALLAWLIPGLIAAVIHYMIIGGALSVMGMGEATNV